MKAMTTYDAFKGLLSFHLIWKAFSLEDYRWWNGSPIRTDGDNDSYILTVPTFLLILEFCSGWSYYPLSLALYVSQPVSSIAHRH